MLLSPTATLYILSKLTLAEQQRTLDGLILLLQTSKRREAIELASAIMFTFGISPSQKIKTFRIDTLEYFKLSPAFGLSRLPQCRIKSAEHSREIDLFHEWHTGMWCQLSAVPLVKIRDCSSVLISKYVYCMIHIALQAANVHLPPELQEIIAKILVRG